MRNLLGNGGQQRGRLDQIGVGHADEAILSSRYY
jgi:hypothetical protein